MIKILALAFFIALSCNLAGQLPIIESKEDVLKTLNKNLPDSVRQYFYNFLGQFYLSDNFSQGKIIDSAIFYLRKAVYTQDSSNTANKEITNESLYLLSYAYLQKGNPAIAKKIFAQIISSYRQQEKKKKEAGTWRRFARDLWNRGIELDYVHFCFSQAMLLYEQEKNIPAKAEVMIDEINFLIGLGKVSTADSVLQLLLKQAKANDAKNLPDIYIMLAKEDRYNGNLDKALWYALEAVKFGNRNRDKKNMHNFYGELAQIYEELGEAANSIYWYKQCIEQRGKLNVGQLIMYRTTSLMVNQMIKIGQAPEALALLNHLAKKSPPAGHIEKASLAQSFAYCYDAMEQYGMAEIKFLEMTRYYNSSQTHPEFLAIAFFDIGQFYVKRKQYFKAGPWLKKSLELGSGSAVLSQQKNLYGLLFKVDSANGNLHDAIINFQHYKILNDSIFNIVKSQQINDLMIHYESEKKDNNILYLEKEGKLQQVKILQANQARNWMVGVVLLLFIITVLLINNARVKQRTNKRLQVQQMEIQVKNNSLQQLVAEKEWLVKEIHHRVKNNFHTVMGLLGTQASYLKSTEAIEAMNESQQRVNAMSLVHQKLYQSDNLSAINMPGYMHELIDYLRDSFNLGKTIQFQLEVEPIELELSHCLPLGLIVNEAVTNAIKYAFPHNKEGIIYIALKTIGENHLLLTIKDNGVGVPSNFTAGNTGAMGMNLMKGLSEDLEGNLLIKNDGGTVILLDFIYKLDSNPI